MNINFFMNEALEQAKIAAKKGEVPVGAVIVKNEEILAEAHNLIETDNDPTAHAETLAIKEAAKQLGNWRLEGCSIYVTLEPCTMCIGAIKQARIEKLYFGPFDEKFGACGSLYDLSGEIETYAEILAKESKDLLKEFFEKLRSRS